MLITDLDPSLLSLSLEHNSQWISVPFESEFTRRSNVCINQKPKEQVEIVTQFYTGMDKVCPGTQMNRALTWAWHLKGLKPMSAHVCPLIKWCPITHMLIFSQHPCNSWYFSLIKHGVIHGDSTQTADNFVLSASIVTTISCITRNLFWASWNGLSSLFSHPIHAH